MKPIILYGSIALILIIIFLIVVFACINTLKKLDRLSKSSDYNNNDLSYISFLLPILQKQTCIILFNLLLL